jgi:hypothetical protein
MKTTLELSQAPLFCALELGMGYSFGLSVAAGDSAGSAHPRKIAPDWPGLVIEKTIPV